MASISDPNSDDKRLLSRVDDMMELCERSGFLRFIGFLDERQSALVYARLHRLKTDVAWRFFGGHDQAERTFLGLSGNGDLCDDAFPIVPLDITWRAGVSLSHRDVLGSLIGCGIAREKIGDILCADGRAVVMIAEDLAPFVADTLKTVGREGVRASYPALQPFPVFRQFRELTATVASPRLDAILKALLNLSREQACDLIRKGLVQINHTEILSVSAPVKAEDRISVRGYGRFRIDSVSDLSKKGRVILRAAQYI